MAAENAKAVAQKVSESIRKGQKVHLGKILMAQGYSKSTSESPQRVTNTKAYREAMKPFTTMLDREIKKIQLEMAKRDISGEKYKELAEVLDKLYKNKQLATGGDTEKYNITISLSDTLAKRYGIKGQVNDTNSSPESNSE